MAMAVLYLTVTLVSGHRGAEPANLEPLVPAADAERPATSAASAGLHLRGLGVRIA